MAYQRDILFGSELLSWQSLALLVPRDAWTDEYRVSSPRLVLPSGASFGCRVGRAEWLCDARTALWLSPESPYRMRQPTRQRSLLIVFAEHAREPGRFGPRGRVLAQGSGAFMTTLETQLDVALWHAQWLAGALTPLQIEERLVDLAWRSVEASAAPGLHRAVDRAREHIAEAPGARHTLASIARAAHCSPFHLARAFRRQTGSSLHQWCNELRLGEAIRRLSQGEHELSALALDLGFSSHSHFTAAFRARLHTTPRALRAKLLPALRTISTAPPAPIHHTAPH